MDFYKLKSPSYLFSHCHSFSPVDDLLVIMFVVVGMQLMKVCLGLDNLSPSQYL